MILRLALCAKNYLGNNNYGALLIVLATFTAATTSSLNHSIQNIPAMEILFFKCAMGLVTLSLYYCRHFLKLFHTTIIKYHAFKGLVGSLGNWAWILSLQFLPLAEASSLSTTSAFFTSLMGIVLYKEPFHRKAWLAIAMGFLGAIIILHPSQVIFSWYIMLPLFSAFCFSISSVLVKSIRPFDSAQTTLIYLLSFMALFSVLSTLITPWVMPNKIELIKMLITGISYLLSQVCLIEAYTYALTSFIAPFKFVRFPLSILTGVLFFTEIPPISTLVGGGIILLGYLWLLRAKKKTKRS